MKARTINFILAKEEEDEEEESERDVGMGDVSYCKGKGLQEIVKELGWR